MSADDFVAMAGGEKFLGKPTVVTQHFLGASRFEKPSDTEIVGTFQIRAAHVRYTDEKKEEVKAKGHGHGTMTHSYKKVDGQWKLSGVRPDVRWNEYNFAAVVGDDLAHWQSQD